MIGHSGFEYFGNATARWPLPLVATVHHDFHHQRFNVNFANQFTIWDRLFGTLDPHYDERVKQMTQRTAGSTARDDGADAS
jgi:sterol desaturase/sphingolipid hydroxylase (fatty acid hydroxylase superfamily)